MISFAIAGIGGRMGRAMAAIIAAAPDKYSLAGGFEYEGHPELGTPLSVFLGLPGLRGNLSASPEQVLQQAQVLLDFTSPGASLAHVRLCLALKKAVVLGTTGLTQEQKEELHSAAGQIPIVFSSNFSIGMNLMFNLVEQMTATLGLDYALELIEAHHDQKVDAPSGTAYTLLEALAKGSGLSLAGSLRHGRQGMAGPRGREEIGVSVIRGGDIVGEHTVMFIGQGERLELTHRVQSRNTFAQGAVRAGAWLAGRSAGLYSMKEVLGLT